ncbi:MAG: hypothetical protein LKE59_07045 [Eubacterium sp.]|nr:hypothetical protein [Eubacterium sp.]MCH4080249.1 hypothetical protein [Eubacterium sp.]MCI1406293.1 hypothetical protein [Eubacterium sp.]
MIKWKSAVFLEIRGNFCDRQTKRNAQETRRLPENRKRRNPENKYRKTEGAYGE